MVLKQSHRRDLTAGAGGDPTHITRRGCLPESGGARFGLSQKDDLPSSGERASHLVQWYTGRRSAKLLHHDPAALEFVQLKLDRCGCLG